jgi:glycosyltransferase involved in cell wall biosynthesis
VKIIHIVGGRPDPDSLNGVETATYHMARAQARLGLAVSVFAVSDASPSPADGVDARAFRRHAYRFRAPAGLIAALEAAAPDVVHLHSPYFPEHVPISRWARRAGVPYVVTPHGALSPGELALRWPLKLPYKYLFERSILNNAAFVHALGAHEHLERYGVRSPIVFVPNGVDPPEPAGTRRLALSDGHPELAGCTIFLFLGRLEPVQKGLDLLIAAVARTGRTDIALVLAGPDYRGGRRRVAQLIDSARCRGPVVLCDPFIGRDKSAALSEADVFAHTSRWEGMPQAVLEAAAQGRPLLVTTVADPAGRLRAVNAAVVVQPTVEAITEGLNRICGMTRAELSEMGERARQVVLSEFTWERTASALKAAYERYTLKAPSRA